MAGYVWVAVCHDQVTNVQCWPVAEDRSRRARISGDFGSNVRTRLLSAIRRPTAGVS
jgi:hypothetical protein